MRRWTRLATVAALLLVLAPPRDAHDAAHAHEEGGDDCGVDAQALAVRFEAARGQVAGGRLVLDRSALAVAGEVNVGLAPGADAAALARRHGRTLVRALPALGLATLSGEPTDALARDPAARFVEPNFAARTAGAADPLQPLQRGWTNARLEAAWELATGEGVLVAVLDTGCDRGHAALAGRVVDGWDFVNGDGAPDDDNGHGTAVTGLIASVRGDGVGLAGVAPGARVLSVKVADALGVASVANVAAGIDLAVARGARVINISLGTRVASRALDQAVQAALAAGAVVVCAAGNDPVHQLVHPAASPGALAVTALGDGDELAWSTSLASGVALGAPGEALATTYPGGVHGFISGSSAAAAFASGVAALVLSREPGLSGPEVARTLRAAQAPLPALAGLERFYRFGRLDARAAVERAARDHAELALVDADVVPTRPIPGAPARVRVAVENRGHRPATPRVELAGGPWLDVPLAPGETRTVELAWTAPRAGEHALELRAGAATRRLVVVADPAASAALRIVERTLGALEAEARALPFTVTVEGVGSAPAEGGVVEARVEAPGGDVALGRAALPPLAPGARATVAFSWTLPVPAPRGPVTLHAVARAGAATAAARFDAVVDGALALSELYQQSNGVDLILDAPWRIEPGRDRVPLLLFAASKGGLGLSGTRLRLDRTTVTVRDSAAATTGTTVYEHVRGRPLAAPPGHAVKDELGRPRASLEPFEGRELDANGRHEVHLLPRAALGVPLRPAAAGEHRFLDAKVEWTYLVPLPLGLTPSRAGSHRSVLRVGFAKEPWPRLPGEGHPHDVHNHTIAEWYFSSPLNVFAPRKAYGGPIVMLREAAYALGVLGSPADVRDRLITTDHNNFYNAGVPTDADHWPPYGEQGLAHHPAGTTKLGAYRAIFGDAAGEEVAVKQDQTHRVNVPASVGGGTVNVTLPIGAHLLLMGGDHQEGAWNGGGWLAGPTNPGPTVLLDDALRAAAGGAGAGARAPFAYAAHPFGGMGWNDPHLEASFGLAPGSRTTDHVDRARRQFVLKGLQLWNGRTTRTLDPSLIDFNDLNPWADPTFAAGRANWDGGLQGSIRRWHDVLAADLEYSFAGDPETRFIRKVFAAAGSDAHGDFNFGVSRMATPVSLGATYHCSNDPWYAPVTWCLADGKPGATAEQRSLQAYADGSTVLSDGPLLVATLDADARLDGRSLRWHAGATAHEDDDGRIGGGGAFDGLGTALVRRGSTDVTYRYRYTNTADFGSNDGQVVALKLYRTEAGAPNPARGGRLVGLADLPLAGEDQDHVRPLGAEGPFTRPSAVMLGAFTGVDPDQGVLGPDEHRCYTNPIFVVPYDAAATVRQVDLAAGVIPAGGLEVELTFDISMEPTVVASLQPLDGSGDSPGRGGPPLQALAATWADRPGVRSSILRLTNPAPIPLQGDAYPAPDRCGFVVVLEDPKDAFGNQLNPVGVPFDAPRVPNPTAPIAAVSTGATVAPGATPGGAASTVAPGGGGSGSGCALAPGAPASGRSPAPLAALVLLLALRRRRRG